MSLRRLRMATRATSAPPQGRHRRHIASLDRPMTAVDRRYSHTCVVNNLQETSVFFKDEGIVTREAMIRPAFVSLPIPVPPKSKTTHVSKTNRALDNLIKSREMLSVRRSCQRIPSWNQRRGDDVKLAISGRELYRPVAPSCMEQNTVKKCDDVDKETTRISPAVPSATNKKIRKSLVEEMHIKGNHMISKCEAVEIIDNQVSSTQKVRFSDTPDVISESPRVSSKCQSWLNLLPKRRRQTKENIRSKPSSSSGDDDGMTAGGASKLVMSVNLSHPLSYSKRMRSPVALDSDRTMPRTPDDSGQCSDYSDSMMASRGSPGLRRIPSSASSHIIVPTCEDEGLRKLSGRSPIIFDLQSSDSVASVTVGASESYRESLAMGEISIAGTSFNESNSHLEHEASWPGRDGPVQAVTSSYRDSTSEHSLVASIDDVPPDTVCSPRIGGPTQGLASCRTPTESQIKDTASSSDECDSSHIKDALLVGSKNAVISTDPLTMADTAITREEYLSETRMTREGRCQHSIPHVEFHSHVTSMYNIPDCDSDDAVNNQSISRGNHRIFTALMSSSSSDTSEHSLVEKPEVTTTNQQIPVAEQFEKPELSTTGLDVPSAPLTERLSDRPEVTTVGLETPHGRLEQPRAKRQLPKAQFDQSIYSSFQHSKFRSLDSHRRSHKSKSAKKLK